MYGKLFISMYEGTLASKGLWQALVTFQQLVILADRHGVVDKTPEAISRITTIPLDIIREGLEALEQPDPDSRTPDEDGRRIVRLSDSRTWGWRIVNYGKYRAIRNTEERREYMRQYQRARRKQSADVNTSVNIVNHVNQKPPIADAEAEVISNTREDSSEVQFVTPLFITLPATDGEVSIHKEVIEELEQTFPDVDVRQQLRSMRAWLLVNRRHWKNVRATGGFIVKWLTQHQDRGHPGTSSPGRANSARAGKAMHIADLVPPQLATGTEP